jgi:mycofactocin system creatininase family protein
VSAATTSELSERTPLLILPLGAWEQHGPHLPLDTDTIIINRVVGDVIADQILSNIDLIVAPTIAITASDEHQGFAGTLSAGTQALKDAVVAICRSASWARGICIVNGHGGNTDALAAITSALQYENITHSIWSLPSYAGGDMHAGHTETSLLLHIAPEQVRDFTLQSGAPFTDNIVDAMREHGVQGISENGIIGDATTATASHGIAVLNLYTRSLLEHVLACHRDWSTAL